MKRSLFALSIVIAVITAAATNGDDKPEKPSDKESYWMRKKLELSCDIMTALARGEMETVADRGRTMKKLSAIEGWARRTDAVEYRKQLKYFQKINSTLIQQAEEDNLDGATLAFTQLTVSCVNCHKVLQRYHRNNFLALL